MKYDLDYQGAAEILESRVITSIPPITGRLLENSYLPEFDQDILKEAERLNAVLPLIKWEVDNNDLSEAMNDGDPSQITLARWERFCFAMGDLAKRRGWE